MKSVFKIKCFDDFNVNLNTYKMFFFPLKNSDSILRLHIVILNFSLLITSGLFIMAFATPGAFPSFFYKIRVADPIESFANETSKTSLRSLTYSDLFLKALSGQ